MNAKDIKEKIEDTLETENPPGTDYYGTELDRAKVDAAREKIDRAEESGTTGTTGHESTGTSAGR